MSKDPVYPMKSPTPPPAAAATYASQADARRDRGDDREAEAGRPDFKIHANSSASG